MDKGCRGLSQQPFNGRLRDSKTELHGWTISAENKDDGLQITIKY